MKTLRFLKLGFLGLALLIILSTCTKDSCEDLGTCPLQAIMERIDMNIAGDMNWDINFHSKEADGNLDLVRYNFYGTPSNQIDFILTLNKNQKLKITMYNSHNVNPWEHIGIDYATYPTQNLDDKWKYVTATYIMGTELPSYSTNLGDNLPPGTTLDVLRITSYNSIQIQCRISNMVMYKNTDPSKTITINGTFTGAVTFLSETI